MLRVEPHNLASRVSFGTNKNTSRPQGSTTLNQRKREQQEGIISAAQSLLTYTQTVSEKTKQMLDELKGVAAKGYPAKELDELAYKAYIAAKDVPAPVYFPNHPLSIWGDLYLDLQDDMKLPEKTKGMMARDVAKVLNGETKMKEVKNPTVWSISYEYTNPVGGQTDIARQQPAAMNKAGINTIAVAPMHNMSVNGKPVNYMKEEDGELYYYTPGNKTKVEKVYEGDLQTGNRVDKFSIYYGEFGPDKQKTLFLYDDDMFNFGDTNTAMVYQDLPHSPERVRMAQFNNMSYEAIAQAAQKGLKLPDGTTIPKPDKIIAHEAWQSAGLLGKMRLYSRAEDAIHSRAKDTTDYLRNLANNTAVVIHNLGDAYQGQSWDRGVMEDYFNVLYNNFARDIVENSCITDVGRRHFGLYGTASQRIGFFENVMNPAHAAVTLATTVGAVSEGYVGEITNKGISSKLDAIMKIKNEKGSLVAFPNGVDKKPLAATKENIRQLNKDLGINAQAYIDSSDDDINSISLQSFAHKKEHNKKLFVNILKNAADNNNEASALIHNNKAANFYEGSYGIDISSISADTPIFSMASRLDSQKGFNTMVDAYSKLVQNMDENDPDFPVLIISGGGDAGLARYIQDAKEKLGEKGKRILFTQERISNSGLLLMNMTTRNCMPSDFEPYGISELKGLYAGSHVIATEVGGMKSEGKISRKIYSLDDYGADKADAITVKDYEFMCLAPDWEKPQILDRNSTKLMHALKRDIALSKEDSLKMDLNALKVDVSWDKGAIQNYQNILNIQAA